MHDSQRFQQQGRKVQIQSKGASGAQELEKSESRVGSEAGARRIRLTRGKYALIDSEDFEELSSLGWYCATVGYAVRLIPGSNPKKFEYMHRRINRTPEGMQTDHINGEKLDNRKANLRTVTQSENLRNTPKRGDNTSGFKGVGYFPQTNRWRATIRFNGKAKHIGFFATREQARDAHTAFIKEHFPDVPDRHFQPQPEN